MKPYSLDLRQKVVDAVDDHIGTYEEIALMFGVHVSFINKLLRRRRETGNFAPASHGGGAQLRLDEKALKVLAELVDENSDTTLEELRDRLRKKTKVNVSVMTVWRGLKKLGITLKKRHVKPRKLIQRSVPSFKRNKRD